MKIINFRIPILIDRKKWVIVLRNNWLFRKIEEHIQMGFTSLSFQGKIWVTINHPMSWYISPQYEVHRSDRDCAVCTLFFFFYFQTEYNSWIIITTMQKYLTSLSNNQ